MECPCENCLERKVYAKTLDIHIYGEDCPYECKEYEHWRQYQKELNGNSIDIVVRCKDCKYSVDLGGTDVFGKPLLVCRVEGVYSDEKLKYPEGYCDEGRKKSGKVGE